jgi:hypothetical protein
MIVWARVVVAAVLGAPVPSQAASRETFDESVAYLGPGDIVEEFVGGEVLRYGCQESGVEVRDEQTYWMYSGGPRDDRSREIRLRSYGLPRARTGGEP